MAGESSVDYSSRDSYIRSVIGYARRAAARLGKPELAPYLVAININEQGGRPAPGNNMFGIKGKNPVTGKSTGSVPTWEDYGQGRVNINDEFRSYNNVGESYDDFVNFLHSNSRYKGAFDTTSPDDFIKAIHRAGYATDPSWSDKIINIARSIGQSIGEAVGGGGTSMARYKPLSAGPGAQNQDVTDTNGTPATKGGKAPIGPRGVLPGTNGLPVGDVTSGAGGVLNNQLNAPSMGLGNLIMRALLNGGSRMNPLTADIAGQMTNFGQLQQRLGHLGDVMNTDTVNGLGNDPFNLDSRRRLYQMLLSSSQAGTPDQMLSAGAGTGPGGIPGAPGTGEGIANDWASTAGINPLRAELLADPKLLNQIVGMLSYGNEGMDRMMSAFMPYLQSLYGARMPEVQSGPMGDILGLFNAISTKQGWGPRRA